MTPAVAIITRTKNRPQLLRRALESVLGQSHTDWTHVIVNDGGDRQALETSLDAYRDRYGDRLQVVHHESSRGMQEAANAGISASQSDYICIHDDDDSWDSTYLEKALGFLNAASTDSRYQGVICKTLEIREQPDESGGFEEIDRRPYIPLSEISLFRLGYENPFPPIAFCYRRSAYEAIGPYDPRFSVAGDYDFNFRFLRQFEIGVIDEALAFYHVRVSGDASLSNSITSGANEHKRRYNEFKNHYLRGEDQSLDPALAVGLNAAKYLVEIEWLVHEIRRRSEKIEGVSENAAVRIPAIEALISRSLDLQDQSFHALRQKLEDPEVIERLGVLLKDLSYLNQVAGQLSQRTEDIAQAQVHRDTALLERLDLRSEGLAAHLEGRAVDILKEVQHHHTAMIEAQREKVLLQIGSFKISWKKQKKPSSPPPPEQKSESEASDSPA